MNEKLLKVLGFVGTVVGLGATLISSFVDNQSMKNEVRKEVSKQLESKEDESDE